MALMSAKDAVSGGLGTCVVKINNRQYEFAHLIKIEATCEKSKTEVPILGKTGRGHKSTGWEGTGSMTLHYNTSIFRRFMQEFKNTGHDLYFDITVSLNDPTTSVGSERVILKDCNIDSLMVANLDVEADYLTEDVDFTFDDFAYEQTFLDPKGEGGGIAHQLSEAGLVASKTASQGFNLFGDLTSGIGSISSVLG